MASYRELDAWNRARSLVRHVYEVTRSFPKEELFGLVSQMRRCAVSIPSNIAEGAGRSGTKELLRFLHIARGSTYELETQIILSSDLELISEQQMETLLEELGHSARLLQGMINAAQRRTSETSTSN